jgi:hypothetical protein
MMRKWFFFLFFSTLPSSGLLGEVVLEFDGKEWILPDGIEELTEEVRKDGVCFLADANVPAGAALEGMGLDQLQSHPVRFALRGQEGQGAKLDPITPGKEQASSVILVICDRGQVAAACMPSEPVSGVPPNSAIMTNDFEGLDGFLEIIRGGVRESEEATEIPRVVVIVRSTTSFGHMVRLLQLVRSAGCRSGLVRVDDEFPSLDFKVLTDLEVVPPVVEIPESSPTGRIVVNIRGDGTLTDRDLNILDGEKDVTDYITRERKKFEAKGLTVRLHLRGDGESLFKHSRNVIRWSSTVGVDQVVFGVYKTSEKKPEAAPTNREQDLEMLLPKRKPSAPRNRADRKDESFAVGIVIDSKNQISMMKGAKMLDAGSAERNLPLLHSALEGENDDVK